MRTALFFGALLLAAAPAAARPEPPSPETAEPAAEAAHEGHGPPGIELFEASETIIPFGAMLVNFAILASALILFAKKPFSAFLVARHHAIQDGLDEAQDLKRRAEEKFRAYGERLAAFQEEVDSLLAEYRKAGEAERAKILSEAADKASRMRREAEFLVSQEEKQIRIDLHRDAVEKAVRAAEERLRAAVAAADQERLANDYLATMSKETRA